MSRLEQAVMPFLPALARGDARLSSLLSKERQVLAKWAAKTAYLHSTAGLLGEPVHSSHINALNSDLGFLASRVAVFASQGEHTRPSSYVQTGLWPQQTLIDVGSKPPAEAYKIGLQYRRLALLVAYWPEPRALLMPAPYHFPVWADGWALHPWAGLRYAKETEPLLMFVNDLGIFDPPHIVIPGWSP